MSPQITPRRVAIKKKDAQLKKKKKIKVLVVVKCKPVDT